MVVVRFKRIIKYGNGELRMVFTSLGLEFLVQMEEKYVFASKSPLEYSDVEAIKEMLDSLEKKFALTDLESDILYVTVMKNGVSYNFRIMGDESMIHILCGYGDSYLKKSLFAYGSFFDLAGVLNLCVGLTP